MKSVAPSTPLLAVAILVLGTAGLTAQQVSTNADGTQTAVYSTDGGGGEKSATYDPYKRSSSDQARDPRIVAQDLNDKFPEERKKELLRAVERSKLTAEDKAREKRMVDRTPNTVKSINPGLKERSSIPKRF